MQLWVTSSESAWQHECECGGLCVRLCCGGSKPSIGLVQAGHGNQAQLRPFYTVNWQMSNRARYLSRFSLPTVTVYNSPDGSVFTFWEDVAMQLHFFKTVSSIPGSVPGLLAGPVSCVHESLESASGLCATPRGRPGWVSASSGPAGSERCRWKSVTGRMRALLLLSWCREGLWPFPGPGVRQRKKVVRIRAWDQVNRCNQSLWKDTLPPNRDLLQWMQLPSPPP